MKMKRIYSGISKSYFNSKLIDFIILGNFGPFENINLRLI